jgi:peptidyl-prolyl cis-trans isomerase SurA
MKTFLTKGMLTAAILLLFSQVWAQNSDQVLMNIAGENVTKSEFLGVYQKNNTKGEVIDQKSLDEYLDLFINFKLKVKEAEVLGLDTVKSFRDELGGYRKQLAQPYLIDEDANKALLDEAYARKGEDIRASHILIRVEKNASPADTLTAYNKLMKIRKRLLKGEDFGKLAAEFSDDESAKDRTQEGHTMKGNKGDMGYFTVFDMVYPFETGAYKTKVGEVSMPVRSEFGYHLIKVTDRKPAMGKVQIAHILFLYPKDAKAADSAALKSKAEAAYKKLQDGEEFAAVAKEFSEDKGTSDKGGVLPWFGVNRMVPEFISEISKLKQVGDYTAPFQTSFGWHIIKLVEQKPIGSFDENKADLKQKLTKNDRSVKSEESFVAKVKKEYNFTEDLKARDEFNAVVTDSIFKNKWKASQASSLTKNLFTIGKATYTQPDFAKYIETKQKNVAAQPISSYINTTYHTFVNEKCMAYEDSQLENKYPEFKALMREYHDGILLFDLTDQKVWSKAIKDTTGLKDFYEKNKNNYPWPERLDATIYSFTDAKALKSGRKLLKKGMAEDKILSRLNHDSTVVVTIEHKKYVKGDNKLIDGIAWVKGATTDMSIDSTHTGFVMVHAVVPPEPKLLNEAKGIITSDYQNYLEKEWIAMLRAKYPVNVDREVLKSIK